MPPSEAPTRMAGLGRAARTVRTSATKTAFMGDDLPDAPVMKRVGCPIAVSDAHREVLPMATVVTNAKGGHGAVREICDAILKAKGLWTQVVKRFEL